MASGSFKVSTSNEYIDGIVKWSSSADVVKNQSTVTATLYLSRTNTGYTTSGSGTFSLTIDGNKGSNTKSYSLTYNSDTVMVTHQFVVDHDDDGKKSIKITASGSGSTFSVTSTSDTVTLDTIQRKSTLTTSANWTAGTNFTLSISRSNSSFKHEAEVYVKTKAGDWNWIKQVSFSTSETSKSSSFTLAEVDEIYRHLDGRSSCDTYINLQTFNGSTQIGSNTYYGTVYKSDDSVLTSSSIWTAGSNFTLNLSRKSSFYNHEAEIYVKRTDGEWDWIKQVAFSTSQTSLSSSFSVVNNEEIFTHLAQRDSCTAQVVLQTFINDRQIGATIWSGIVNAPSVSTMTPPTSFNIGSSFTVTVNRSNSAFTHTVRLKNGSTVLLENKNVGTSTTFSTSGIASTLYDLTKTSKSIVLTLECITFCGDSQVKSTGTTKTITANVINSNPTFTSNNISYVDSNPKTLAITGTGNSTYIIQNQSTPKITITAATGINSATISNYIANINGSEKSRTTAGTLDMPVVNADKDVTLSVKAIDSRSNFTTATKTVTVLPYKNPTINISLKRKNNFENETTLKITGSISLLTINGVNKNQLSKIEYRYKATTSSTWSEWKDDASYNTVASSYTATKILDLDNQYAYQVEVKVTDALVTVSSSGSVPVGIPIFFIDAINNAVGVNALPLAGEAARIKGKLVVDGEFTLQSTIWTDISLLNGWINYGSYATAQHTKTGNIVYVNGLIKGGLTAIDTVLFNLPSGRRPSKQIVIMCIANNTEVIRVDIAINGDVILKTVPSTSTWLSLNGIVFTADGS